MQADTISELEVCTQDFITELRRTWRVLGRQRPVQTLLGFSDNRLWLRCGGASFELEATGHWPGEARVASAVLHALSKAPPPGSRLTLRVTKDKLKIGSSVAACYWQPAGSAIIEPTLGHDLAALLRLSQQHDDNTLAQSGILPEVEAARIRLSKKLATASRALVALGISEDALHHWVRRQLGLEQESEVGSLIETVTSADAPGSHP